MAEGRVAGAQHCQVLLGERAAEHFPGSRCSEEHGSSPGTFLQTWEFSTAGECERVGVPGDWAR